MTPIFDPDPDACAAALRADLDIVAEVLRRAGAEIDVEEYVLRSGSHTILFTASVRGSVREAKALSAILARLADETSGFSDGTMTEPAGDADAEYRAFVGYQIMRPPTTRRRRSSLAQLAA